MGAVPVGDVGAVGGKGTQDQSGTQDSNGDPGPSRDLEHNLGPAAGDPVGTRSW